MSSRHTQREIVLLMAREIDPQESAPEDDECISEWVPEHSCGGHGDPTCAGCWVQSYDDRAVQPEWEYACRDEATGFLASAGAPWMTLEYAQRVSASSSSVVGVRRHKAGTWSPVDTESTDQ